MNVAAAGGIAMTDAARSRPDDRLLALASLPCRADAPRLGADQLRADLAALPGWRLDADTLRKSFRFPDFRATMTFVNAVAWIADREDHHPDLAVGYGRCDVTWSTHSAGGVTQNDLVCAARVERLFA
jgi:4a-hydroxytetrahydrobiopterin dehydratase